MVTISRNLDRMTSDTTIKVTTILEDDGSLVLVIRDLMTLVEEYHDDTHLNDPTDMNEIMCKTSELIDSAPETKVRILAIDAPIRNGLIMKPVLGIDGEGFLTRYSMNLASDNIRLESTDDALAVAQWEKIGAERKNDPMAQLSWSKSGRLLSLQSSYDHMGIGLIDGGRLLSGISLPYDGYYSIWGSQLKILNRIHHLIESVKSTGRIHHPLKSNNEEQAVDLHYYQWQLHNITTHEASCWAPDHTILTIDGPSSLAPSKTTRSTDAGWSSSGATKDDNIDYDVIASDSAPDDRVDLISMGATLIERRNMFGWAPKFLLDAEKREEENDEILEYEFDLSDDDSDDEDIIVDTAGSNDIIETISNDIDASNDSSSDDEDKNEDNAGTSASEHISKSKNDDNDAVVGISPVNDADKDSDESKNENNADTGIISDEDNDESGVDDELIIISDDASDAEAEELVRGMTEQ